MPEERCDNADTFLSIIDCPKPKDEDEDEDEDDGGGRGGGDDDDAGRRDREQRLESGARSLGMASINVVKMCSER